MEELAKVAVNLWAAYPPQMEINKVEKSKDQMAMFAVNQWAADSPQKKSYKVGKSKKYDSKMGKGVTELPNYEGRAMAIILYSMKLIFGLDGFTELKLSQFARKANKILSLHHSHKEFFVWGDWVKYIEFRKQLVERYHFPSSYNDEPEEVYMFRDLYSTVPPLPLSQSFYKCVKFLDPFSEHNGHCGKKGEAEWRRFMKKELDEIIGNEAQLPIERLHVNFEPSVTPYFSYFKQLHGNMVLRKSWSRNVNGAPCEQLFNASFHGTSLAFVLTPKSCIQDLKEKGVSVTVVEGSACSVGDVKLVKPVQIIRETNSDIPIKKRESVEVVLTDDSVNSNKKICWFEKIDKAKLFLNLSSKKKVSSSVAADQEVPRTPKNNLRQPSKKHNKSKQSRKQKMKMLSKEVGEERLTLHLPHRKVWMFYGSFLEQSELQFYYLTHRFPSSFQWLLNLSAKNLEMSEVSLYSELVDVELVHKSNQALRKSTKTRDPDTYYEHRRTTFARNNW
ncbi:hypothetical protein J437_LFUL011953 [Ladona fulva]|uniref:Uncharacterized protein n=1 Tax=Ladona fulva TaxID=123851 RepID=A0A8K0P3R7_LADFU|nr:hypothetical protein J437_LFUL011953 [Ladona fulva]